MRMKKYLPVFKAVLVVLFLNICLKVSAQCPASVTASIASQTVATCPSNASVTIGSNANSITTTIYQVLTAPSGVSLAPQSSNIFTSLPPGNYTFRVTCGPSTATVGTTITTTYTQLTATTVVTNVCSSYTAGGTITVSAAGGTTPYTYSLLKTINANYSDVLSNYGASNTLNPTDTGTYQVRIKDNCGNFITKTVVVQPLVPAIYLNPSYLSNDQPCGSGNVRLHYYLTDINGVGLSSSSFVFGYKLDIYQKGTGCTRGAFIKTVNKAQNSSDRVVIPANQDLYIKVTNSCGDTTSGCYIYPVGEVVYKIFWDMVQTGCVSTTNPNGLVTIANNYSQYGKGPELFSVIKLDGTVVRTATVDSSAFHNLPYGTYVVVGQDACGLIAKDTLVPPSIGDAVYFDEWQDLDCTNQTGTLTYNTFVGGYVNDLEHAVLTIISGPSNVGVVGRFYPEYGVVRWANMLPGNYVASIVTPCGTTLVNFSLVPNIGLLQQNLVITTQQVCNNGGVIYSDLTYNGYGDISFTLYNSSNVSIATNTIGIFTGVGPGTYKVKAMIELGGECPNIYTVEKPAIILLDGAPPLVTKKIVTICEDGSGNPTANGKAIIKSAGFAPFKVEVKRVVESDANYVLKYASSISDFTVDNLTAYENYRIRITDQCGNTALTDVSVGILEQLTPVDNGIPCYTKQYTLSAPDMIDATYTWRLGGVIVATTKDIVFPNYVASNDGLYTCTISIGGGCVTRIVSNNLNGTTCVVLPIKIESFTGKSINCKTQLNWQITNTTGTANVIVERSNNGVNYTQIKSIDLNTGAGITQSFVDENAATNNYYRLTLIDADGKQTQSKVVVVKNNCIENNKMMLYPNPVAKNEDISLKINTSLTGLATIKVFNNVGQKVLTQKLNITNSSLVSKLETSSLASGVYLVTTILPNGLTLQQKLVKF
jgi:Secretion system C-terminal sorting domain